MHKGKVNVNHLFCPFPLIKPVLLHTKNTWGQARERGSLFLFLRERLEEYFV